MSRLPFDLSRVQGPEEPLPNSDAASARHDAEPARRGRKKRSPPGESSPFTVSQVSELIKATLETIDSPLRVVGEVSNLNPRNHWYFSLKDDTAVLQCVAWATAAKKFGFTPKDGDEVVATGHISHYGPQGKTQLYVSDLQPVGAGVLDLRFRALCEELRKLGYFEESRKKPLPLLPRRIAVLTSLSGAAVQDVIATAGQRCKAVGLLLVDVRVQGEGAVAEIARAIRWVDHNASRLGVDAILVTRGGGSIEDLWAFNERAVADAAFGCRLPLVAAIGHESDTTVIELVADVRASTPTQAAMQMIPAAPDLLRQVEHLRHHLGAMVLRGVDRERRRLDHLSMREFFREPRKLLRLAFDRLSRARSELDHAIRLLISREQFRLERLAASVSKLRSGAWLSQRHARLAVVADRMDRAMAMRVHDGPRLQMARDRLIHVSIVSWRGHRDRLDGLHRQLVALDPHGVLGRGYSLTTDREGTLIRSIRDVQGGTILVTRVSDGSIESTVGMFMASAAAGQPVRRGGRPDRSDQPGLFDFGGDMGQTTEP